MSTENALLTILVEKINNDTLVLPTLPETAVRVREAADNPDINLMQMADVIAHDPALSARMIKVANSAFLGRTVKVETLNQAVTRIGLRQIKNIATAMAMEQLFVSKNPLVKDYLSKSWGSTVDTASLAIALMQFYVKAHRHSTSLSVDTITLAALVHNIGILPILTEAERHQEVFANPTFLNQAISRLAGRIGGAIMRAWGFGDEFIDVTERWADFTFNPEKVGYVDFVRLGAIQSKRFNASVNLDAYVESYIGKDIIPNREFLQSPELDAARADIRAVFS